MPIKRILKILGYIFVPLLPMAVAVYFLFPYLNEEKHNEVAEKHNDEFKIGDTTDVELSSFSPASAGDESVNDIGEDFTDLKEKTSEYQKNIDSLQKEVDSLTTVNDSLEQQLAKGGELAEGETANSEISEEKFSENIKSLLDLDIENLTPILSKMSDDQLVRMFKAGSGLQRKKLLRSLESDRAAELMTEVL